MKDRCCMVLLVMRRHGAFGRVILRRLVENVQEDHIFGFSIKATLCSQQLECLRLTKGLCFARNLAV